MPLLSVSEYTDLVNDSVPVVPSVAQQAVSFGAGSPGVSAAFQGSTNYVDLVATAPCSVAFGASPSASTSDAYLAAGQRKTFRVPTGGGLSVAVIHNPA